MISELFRDLSDLGIEPNEEMGQHFLIDQSALDLIAEQIYPGARVIEIGSGPGNLTRSLAVSAANVIGIELDKRYQPLLEQVQDDNDQVEIVYTDALRFPYSSYTHGRDTQECQIVGNIPYHITEPLLKKLAGLPVANIILMLGDNYARLLRISDSRDMSYSKASLLAQTFFHVDQVGVLGKDSFYPVPRTDSEIVRLTPRNDAEFDRPALAIQKELFLTEHQSPTIEKVLKFALDKLASQGAPSTSTKIERNRSNRRATRMELRQYLGGNNDVNEVIARYKQTPTAKHQQRVFAYEDIKLPERILSAPFSRLDNPSIRLLIQTLEDHFGIPE